jgi:hypothetical protein
MSKNTNVPAYLSLVAQLLATCDEIGAAPLRAGTTSTLPENSGYCFLRFGDANSAALIIPKSTASVKLCDIHIDASDTDGWVDLRKANGRVMGHIDPASVSDWSDLITRLVGASKRPTVRASKGASAPASQADMSAFLATLQGLGSGAKPVASPAPVQAPVVTDDEEFEDDMVVDA